MLAGMIHSKSRKKIILARTTAEHNTKLAQQFDVLVATTTAQVFDHLTHHADIAAVVLDQALQLIHWDAVTRGLKENFSTFHIVVIILTTHITSEGITAALTAGADDYLAYPLTDDELAAHIALNLHRSQRDQNSNPLTRLPGNTAITRIISERLGQPLALLYIDLDNFKAYNDYYGFQRGDMVLVATATLITTIVKNHGSSLDFVGHLGGDDFVVITVPDRAEIIAQHLCSAFDTHAATFYEEPNRATGAITVRNRRGILQTYPIITLSVAIVWNKYRSLTTIPLIASIAAELKWYAKTIGTQQAGSRYVKDRRCG
jgi:diguanylate cyclase (GGDEF)-like protein